MTVDQLSLLPGDTGSVSASVAAVPQLPARARRSDPPTTKAAAAAMTPMALNRQRTAALNVIKALMGTPYDGGTAWDVARSIGCQQNVAARRLKDLEEMGYVTRTSRTRPGSGGVGLIVWTVVR